MWNDLTMQQRADVISMAVKAGMRDLNSIRSFYDESVGSSREYKKDGYPIKPERFEDERHLYTEGGVKIGRPFWQSQAKEPTFMESLAKFNRQQELKRQQQRQALMKQRQALMKKINTVGRKLAEESMRENTVESNDNAWVETPMLTRKKNPHLSRKAEEGAKAHAAWEKQHPVLNTIGTALSAAPFVVAAAPLLAAAGEAAAPILANPYIDAALTSGFGAHGLNHAINEGIDGWGDAAMTALEVTPLGRLARPMWNAGKEAIYNVVDRYMFMPHQGSYTRGIGMTDAGLQDAVTTGVFRGNPRGTEQTAKMFDKMFLKNRNHFRDIVKDTGIPGIESRYQSRTLTKEDFGALKRISKKYAKLASGDNVGKITLLRGSTDPLSNYATYEDYRKAVASDIAKTEQMPIRIASGEIVPNTELSEPMWFEDESGKMLLPKGKPFLERFGPNSDYLADGTPLSYWYADGRNPVTQGHAYARSNYGVRVNNPGDYQPFMHELHLHPSFFRSPRLADPNVEVFGKGPFGLTVKLDKETMEPLWKQDLRTLFLKAHR